MAFKNWKNLVSEEELNAQIEKAKALAIEADTKEPRAISVSYNQTSDLVMIALKNGAFFSFPPNLLQGLGKASSEELNNVWLDESGSSVHWDSLDVDFELTSLVASIFGTKVWMSELGRKGGKVTSSIKAEAARNNGKKGGRPKKVVQDLQNSMSS